MSDHRRTRWSFLGRVPYAEAQRLQEELRDARVAWKREAAGARGPEAEEHLLLLEHPHVYTLGRNADGVDVTAAPGWLAARGVGLARCDRGGQVTYHGPGQLVGYPVVDLDPDRRDLRRYVNDLKETLVRTLADLGVAAEGRCEQELIGVWVGERKIASLGVHVKRWVTTHGFALNVTTDLGYFDGIVPCGLDGVRMTSVEAETGARPPLARVAEIYARHFGAVFGRRMVPMEASALLASPAASASPTSSPGAAAV